MLISTSNVEYPDCPFLYDNKSMKCFDVVFSKKINTLNVNNMPCNIFSEIQKIKKDIDYYVIIQVMDKYQDKYVYISYHTWILLQMNNNISIIPKNINIYSNFNAGIYPITANICEIYENNIQKKQCIGKTRTIRQGIGINNKTREYAKIDEVNNKIVFSPNNSCNFSLDCEDYPVNTFVSIIDNPVVYIQDNNIEKKQSEKAAVTLHVVIKECNYDHVIDTIKYIEKIYNINLSNC